MASSIPDDVRLHGDLIGRQGSRRALNTPALVLDLDALDRNIAAMAALASAKGAALRPHAKTHKSIEIARRQIAAGAVGVCCAKLGEAEALAHGGIGGLHITSPVVSAPGIERLLDLNARTEGLSVVVDHAANAAALAAAARAAGQAITVLVDIDPGIHRTGVASAGAAVALARQALFETGLTYGGVQFYCGLQQHIEDFDERRAAIEERTAYLSTILQALEEADAKPAIVTGGGSGTQAIDLELGVLTELQVGSYVFMDDQYAACGLPFEFALFVDARVISANAKGLVTLDAGLKAFATEAGPPSLIAGAPDGARYIFMGDEQGALVAPGIEQRLALGDVVTLAAPHCDPTVNLYDSYHLVRGDTLIDIWPVDARGRSR